MVFRPLFSLSPLLRFTLRAVGLYLLWFGGYEHYLARDGRLDEALTHNLAVVSGAGLRAMGFAATVSQAASPVIALARQPLVSIWHACNGLALYALFSAFVVAFPGPVRPKLWFIPLGIGLIYGLNVVRIMALCLNAYYAQRTVDFNHHYTFTFLVYAFILGLWWWWAARQAPAAPVPAHGAA